MSPSVIISRNADAGRYEAHLDGTLAGTCQYQLQGPVVTFTHTVVDPAFEGRGVGSALARQALEDAHTEGHRVVAQCSFIAAYIQRHESYSDLLLPSDPDA
ncbi:GNAT family N-acetyltransferase [Xylophilus sp. Kf1]|nr:GNAT family N-acetyltransferase [Xylophilus sp. Kf1]